jgi:hypothetical protein
VTASIPAELARRSRPFTIIMWLLWTLIPTAAWAAQSWAIELATAGLPNPASVDVAIGIFFLTTALLVPLVASSQCFMLHRIWPDAYWLLPAWFFINIGSVVTMLVLVRHQTFAIILVGLVPAITLSLASPKSLRLSVFVKIFLSFAAGTGLVWAIPHSSEIALLIGTAVSGQGLWIVSRRISRHDARLRNVSQGG